MASRCQLGVGSVAGVTDRLVLLAHTVATLGMVGVMWTVQLVVYPQFRSVPAEVFPAYAADHASRVVLALVIFAPLEIAAALALWMRRPYDLPPSWTFVAGALLAVAWIATAVWYAPFHGHFQREPYDLDRINRLISTNWARTAVWTVRGAFAVWFLSRSLGDG